MKAQSVAKRRAKGKVEVPKELLLRMRGITAKRARTVIDHILKHGQITTEELSETYGYDHPPRAARDVREQGIPLETVRVTGSHGRKIATYRFGDLSKIKQGKLGGRKALPKSLKVALLKAHGSCCSVCGTRYESRYLQIDHRISYEVGGEPARNAAATEFMLLCGSCNRAKSWSCEHCRNGTADLSPDVCRSCYWATPEDYAHVALRLIRRLDVTWSGEEVPQHDLLLKLSKHARKKVPEFVKEVLREALTRKPD